jgi:hypothetical protein
MNKSANAKYQFDPAFIEKGPPQIIPAKSVFIKNGPSIG